MSKSSVESLVKTMLGPIEDRLIKLEETVSCEEEATSARGEYGVEEVADVVNACSGMRPYTVIRTDEYERLLRIEAAASDVLSALHIGLSHQEERRAVKALEEAFRQ